VDKILLTTKGNMIVADSAGKRTIHDLEMEGVGIVPVKKFHGSILAGIQIVQNYQIVVTSRSENVIKELQNYIWSNRMGQIPVDVYNHALDAVRYYAMENTYDTESVWL
jgi:phage terminase large subunit